MSPSNIHTTPDIVWTMENYYYKKLRFSLTRADFNTYVLEERGQDGGILVMSFNTFGVVNVEDEIAGHGDCLYRAVQLSRDNAQTVFVGIDADYGDTKRLSVFVAHRGELIDILDSTQNAPAGYTLSDRIKVFNVSGVKIAVLVDTDATSSKVWRAIAETADMVLAVNKTVDEHTYPLVKVRADGAGIPVLFAGSRDSFFYKGHKA